MRDKIRELIWLHCPISSNETIDKLTDKILDIFQDYHNPKDE